MKIVLAPDKFKGSLTGLQFCNAVEEGIKEILPKADIIKMPLADGGDGTIDILEYHLKGNHIHASVNDPLFREIEASYLYMDSSETAFIEMAEASGMHLLKKEEQNCFYTTTLGTGELILDAINKGAKTIILGIGGSATNDCGMGMATALGYKFEDEHAKALQPIGKNLSKVKQINTNNVINHLKSIDFKVACDVTNPLYGKDGAAYVYGSQKGASDDDIKQLDEGLKNIATVFKKQFNIDVQNVKGAGAAGGMGAGTFVFLNAELKSGIDLVKDLVDFDTKIKDADWIITGEGKLDSQTLSGKTINGVIKSAKKQHIAVAALCGSISLSNYEAEKFGILYTDSIMEKAKSLDDAIQNGYDYVKQMAVNFAKTMV
ncbi:Glycerate 2-kinase [Mariniflexile rhizosphaerae]|uniref:glycerate kinase n=1 Tax=unclassified Mariniflexile TaxID=2643887 RepID=UPI000CC6B723|nr:glycerate kinase [Mariniflexile sp. TRM1-10]AXP80272.1 Glycerate 2-kinase [Mariniflexile sp. TRM1-10]PLB17993.1 MAG: Glycerate kinase [Flavobacteriaceae bacterium FS1-H7996/R]